MRQAPASFCILASWSRLAGLIFHTFLGSPVSRFILFWERSRRRAWANPCHSQRARGATTRQSAEAANDLTLVSVLQLPMDGAASVLWSAFASKGGMWHAMSR